MNQGAYLKDNVLNIRPLKKESQTKPTDMLPKTKSDVNLAQLQHMSQNKAPFSNMMDSASGALVDQ